MSAKTAIVTGAGSGIGRATAHRLADEGFHVIAVGRTEAKLQETLRGYSGKGKIDVFSLDVADRKSTNAFVAEIAKFEAISVLVNNAGVNTKKRTLEDLTAEEWDRQVGINLTGVYNMTAAVLPIMRKNGGGLIVNVSSIAAVRPSKLAGAAYSASKAGVSAFSSVISQEESKNGIRCTALCPGEVDTPILDERPEPITEERRAVILKPEDVAAAVAFLVSLPSRAHVPELVVKPTAHLWS
jgi:NAD(P)-dependent dehydrogenase (short-subunit alcohol dehydrogenase family)